MQLLCNGVRLDVSEGTQLAFKRANILFAFDSIECERTLSFTLPSTPTNERVIGLAKLPEMSGEGMRRKFACQMQFGAVALDGYLYVTEYTKKGYAAVFVTGELLGLQALRDAGKVADILDASTIVTWTAQKMTPQQAQGELWAIVDYMTQGHVNASIEIEELIAAVCEGLDIAEPEIPDAAQGARIIPAKMRSLAEVGVTIARTFVSAPSTEQPGAQVNAEAITIVPELFDANVTGKTYRLIQERVEGVIVSTMYYSVVQQLRTKAPVTITFPSDFPSDVFIGYFSNAYEFGNFTFFGDYAFSLDTAKTITGTPLAGRSVDIPSGANFVFLRYDEYHNAGDPAGTIVNDTGFELTGNVTAAVMVQGTEDTVPFGSVVRLQDNLPDVTLVELLKIVAALSGTVLTYSAQGGVAFDEVDVSGWQIVCVDSKLMELTDVRRTFGKYAQRNVVECESADYVPESARVKAVYTIDNDNIEEEQVLQVVPFSEGRNGGATGSRSYIETEGGEDEEKDSIADAATSLPKMLRVQLPLCDGVQGLCTRSTCISVRVAMSYYEYNAITPQTLIQVRGVRYVWTEATWQNGVARFSLSAI